MSCLIPISQTTLAASDYEIAQLLRLTMRYCSAKIEANQTNDIHMRRHNEPSSATHQRLVGRRQYDYSQLAIQIVKLQLRRISIKA